MLSVFLIFLLSASVGLLLFLGLTKYLMHRSLNRSIFINGPRYLYSAPVLNHLYGFTATGFTLHFDQPVSFFWRAYSFVFRHKWRILLDAVDQTDFDLDESKEYTMKELILETQALYSKMHSRLFRERIMFWVVPAVAYDSTIRLSSFQETSYSGPGRRKVDSILSSCRSYFESSFIVKIGISGRTPRLIEVCPRSSRYKTFAWQYKHFSSYFRPPKDFSSSSFSPEGILENGYKGEPSISSGSLNCFDMAELISVRQFLMQFQSRDQKIGLEGEMSQIEFACLLRMIIFPVVKMREFCTEEENLIDNNTGALIRGFLMETYNHMSNTGIVLKSRDSKADWEDYLDIPEASQKACVECVVDYTFSLLKLHGELVARGQEA